MRATLVVSFGCAALALVLAAMSPLRLVGDGPEYLAMTERLSHAEGPSMTTDEARDRGLEYRELRTSDGRQVLPHFWFYSALTAPFFAGARALGVNPLLAFTAANTVLLAIAAWAIARRYRAITVALLLAGPIIWWIDKAHTEVFAYALITITVTMLPTRSIVSLLAAAVLAAQNPQALGFFACVSAWLLFRWRTSLPPPIFWALSWV